MSWRATPSRPAPPITSTSVDQLFGPSSSSSSTSSASGTPRSSRSYRSISSPHGTGSAASHLARQMAGMDDDARSIRSTRSSLTVSGNDPGAYRNGGGGRSRAGSYAASVASGRTARGGSGSTGNSIKGGKSEGEAESFSGGREGEEEMELEDSPSGRAPVKMDIKGKGKAVDPNVEEAYKTPPQLGSTLERPESTEGGGTIPQVVKRQKTDSSSPLKSLGKAQAAAPTTTAGPASSSSRIASGASWLGSRGWKAAPVAPTALVSEDTTPKLVLSDDSPKKAGDPIPRRPSPATPSAPTIRKEPSLVSFVPDPPSASTSTLTPAPLSTQKASSSKTSELAPPPQSTASTASRRTSWFGGPSISTSSSSASLSRLAHVFAEADPTPAPPPLPTAAPPAPTPSIPTIDAPSARSDPETTPKASKIAPVEVKAGHLRGGGGSGGWLSLLNMSRSVSQASDLGKVAEGVQEESTKPAQESEDVLMKDGTKPEVDDTEAKDATIKAAPAVTLDDATLRLPKREIPSVANQRASWWGWGGAAVEEPAQTQPSVEPSQTSEPAPVPVTLESEPQPEEVQGTTSPVPAPVKTWRQTLWGGGDEAPPQNLADRTADLSIDNAAHRPSSESMNRSSLSGDRPPSLDTVPPIHPLPAPVQSLRHKSSWFFSSSPKEPTFTSPTLSQGGGGSPTASGTSTPAYPISIHGEERGRTTVSQMSKSPLTGLGMSHSIASSRASSHTNDSAPNSPKLGPQTGDGPVKPLTGSLRSSPRPGSHELDPPPENLVLPTFGDTFNRAPRSFPPKKGTLTKAVSVVSAYLFSQPPSPNIDLGESRKFDPAERLPKDLSVMGEASRLHKIKRVVTIGVHGWFPNPMLKSVMGEPTGTSVKFATQMHDAVQTYLESHDISAFNIQAIALEGSGKIDDRVNRLWDQLVGRDEWLQALKKADAVFLATHSQGSIVSTHLLARMLKEGLVQGGRTHMLAMCGIVQGPFIYLSQSYTLTPYFNYLESAAARELFEFQDPDSPLTVSFLKSLQTLLDHGLKITCVGSINDQVVPLYSSLFAGISHPSLIRAIYIDSAAFRTSDFLANLVVFACRLRNANLSDHDLLVNVSEALAGALTGVGHSIVYESLETFTLAVRYQFETTGLGEAPTHHPVAGPSNAMSEPLSMAFNPRAPRNPYLLTWAMRGIVEDPFVRDLFGNELVALREAFETWRPATKILKDVKLKLEGIRMLPRVKKDGKL